jgi:hypothetical protein
MVAPPTTVFSCVCCGIECVRAQMAAEQAPAVPVLNPMGTPRSDLTEGAPTDAQEDPVVTRQPEDSFSDQLESLRCEREGRERPSEGAAGDAAARPPPVRDPASERPVQTRFQVKFAGGGGTLFSFRGRAASKGKGPASDGGLVVEARGEGKPVLSLQQQQPPPPPPPPQAAAPSRLAPADLATPLHLRPPPPPVPVSARTPTSVGLPSPPAAPAALPMQKRVSRAVPRASAAGGKRVSMAATGGKRASMAAGFRRLVVCVYCGQQTSYASLGFHQKECAKKRQREQQALPKEVRRRLPAAALAMPPPGEADDEQAYEEYNAAAQAAYNSCAPSCPTCHRTFFTDRLLKHMPGCTG